MQYCQLLLQEEESGGSSTDMSICRSEALFSSMRDSAGPQILGGQLQLGGNNTSLIQDSLVDLNFSEQVKVNKNNYTLTFSGHEGGAVGSLIASMAASEALPPPKTDEVKPDEEKGKLTTWSNLGKHRDQQEHKEENSLNNNKADDPNLNTGEGRLVHAFIKSKEGQKLSWDGSENSSEPNNSAASGENIIPMMRSKDTVNNFLKNASKLTSIEENSGEPKSTKESTTPVATPVRLRHKLLKQPRQRSAPARVGFPDLSFLENDVGLWDAFFMHGGRGGQTRRPPVLRQTHPPPLPVDEYLQQQQRRVKSAVNTPTSGLGYVKDIESLRTLLPTAHKHLLGPQAKIQAVGQACRSLSELHVGDGNNHDIHNQAIKNASKPQVVKVKEAWVPGPNEETPVEVVRRRRRLRSHDSNESNLNVINNNGEVEDTSSRRRSYHPQDYLSKVLEPTRSPRRRKGNDFPKVISHWCCLSNAHTYLISIFPVWQSEQPLRFLDR